MNGSSLSSSMSLYLSKIVLAMGCSGTVTSLPLLFLVFPAIYWRYSPLMTFDFFNLVRSPIRHPTSDWKTKMSLCTPSAGRELKSALNSLCVVKHNI